MTTEPGEEQGTDQPFLHDLVTCLRAPTVAVSAADGQVRPGGAQGLFDADVRVLSRLEVRVDGAEAEPVGAGLVGSSEAEFVGVLLGLGDRIADPTVTLTRARRIVSAGLSETLRLRNDAQAPVRCRVEIAIGVDLATMTDVKTGQPGAALEAEPADDGLRWSRAGRVVELRAAPPPDLVDASGGRPTTGIPSRAESSRRRRAPRR